MPRLSVISCLPVLLLLLLPLCSCAPKNSTVIDINTFEKRHVYGETDLEELILVGDYLYGKKDYQSLKHLAEGYLEKNSHNAMGCIYVKNLLAELVTYEVVDFERSFTLNEALIETTERHTDKSVCLQFNRDAHEYVEPTLGSRVLFSSVMVIAWVDPSSWKEAKDAIVGKTKKHKIKDTKFIKQYFTIPVKTILQMSQQRLSYLNELIEG